jgi:hypothetical protein
MRAKLLDGLLICQRFQPELLEYGWGAKDRPELLALLWAQLIVSFTEDYSREPVYRVMKCIVSLLTAQSLLVLIIISLKGFTSGLQLYKGHLWKVAISSNLPHFCLKPLIGNDGGFEFAFQTCESFPLHLKALRLTINISFSSQCLLQLKHLLHFMLKLLLQSRNNSSLHL